MAAHHSSSSSGSTYEVFLSFHGKDVRNNFADHLYHALVDAGIRTFRDEDELPKGNKIGPTLLAAIQQSRISIPIFSENYASSKWCLNELNEISECSKTGNQIVFPIFYKVEPRDVRSQQGPYATAFEEHQMRFDEITMQKWKKALTEAGYLDGWHCKEDTREAELVKAVVKTVWGSLNKRPLNVSDNQVGIQSHIKEMLRLLDVESDDRLVVGIHGLGGIGKTTIAKVVYNTVFHHFEGYSFIENIQKNYKKHGLIHLQNQLIFDILKQENQITGSVDGKFVIQQRFCRKKVLIVLDDVDQNIQAESLVGNRDWFGIGSKIIITSRNKDILRAQGVDKIYEPNVMDLDDSLQLFSRHAFKRDQPLADYWDISKDIVKTTGGLPLALEAIGSSLFLKEKTIWEAMLKKLQKVPHDEVVKRLAICYDGLNEEEQQMFLDTACFFIGMNKDIVCHIWDGCGYSSQAGLHAFCARSLVTISEEGELRMHNQLRDLGRHIVYQEGIDEPGKRTRIWSKKEVLEVLDTQAGTTNVRGICCTDFNDISSRKCLRSEGFAAMRKLRLLQVDYAHFSGNLVAHSFSELRWLSWKGCPDQNLLSNFCQQKLVVIDLSHSEITETWMGWDCIKMAVNLKVLNLTSCCRLSTTPDLSTNRHMEVLILKDCSSLVEIDPSIAYLRNLVNLDMSGCISIVTLPIGICKLTSLQRLDVSECSSIEYISDLPPSLISLSARGCKSMVKLSSTSGLRNLEQLYLDGCKSLEEIHGVDDGGLDSLVLFRMVGKSLEELPNLSNYKKLRELVISDCQKLSNILQKLAVIDLSHSEITENWMGWNCIKMAVNLKVLNLTSCCRLSSTPDLSANRHTEVLILKDCSSLVEIDPSITYLRNLVSLDMSGCISMVTLPIEICKLTSLRRLDLKRCGSINKLPDIFELLISLTELDLSFCYKLESLTNLPLSLTSLDVSECSSIEYISDLPSSLISLSACGCKSMVKLSSTSGLRNLERLYLDGCNSLEEIQVVDDEGLDSLVLFRMVGYSLKKLPNLSNSKKLRELVISGCQKISKIEGLENFESLETLTICNSSMERLPDLPNLNKLQELMIERFREITEIPGLNRLESLRILKIKGCRAIKRLPDLSSLKILNVLKIEDCTKLTEIHGVDRLEFLELLNISGCWSLKRLPDLSNLIKLEQLIANGCQNLTEIPAVERLELLQKLEIGGCKSLERLPDLSNLKNLNVLKIRYCWNLAEINHGVDRLEFLEKLEISWCESLERLPDLSNLKNLNILKIHCCWKLTEIHGVDRMEFLEKLEISGCESLKRLPDLSNLKSLNDLKVEGCRILTEIHGIDRLGLLEKLDISGCQALQSLPDLSNLIKLEQLRANGCKKLTRIHGVDRLEFLRVFDISG